MVGSGFSHEDGIYRSLRPQVDLPFISNLPEFIFSRNSHGARPALIDAPTGKTISVQELHESALSLAAGLRRIGIRQGDVVMILSPNSLQYPVAFLGAMIMGAVVTTVNPLNTPGEVAKQAEDSDSKLVFTVPLLVHKISGLGLPVILMSPSQDPTLSRLQTLHGLLQKPDTQLFEHPRINWNDTAALLYSSGTTGTSKGVILSHGNLITAATIHASSGPEKQQDEVFICVIPMFHVFGFVIIVCTQLSRGVPIVVMPGFDLEAFLVAIQRYKVTNTPVVPPIVIALGKSPAVERFDLGSLREIGCGAAPLGKEVINACVARFPGVGLKQGYGLTESSAIATLGDPEDTEHYGSAGLLCANTQAKVIDVETGRPLPPNQQGEIWLHGPTIMQGYLRNPKATAETVDAEGWLHTGDLGYFDDSGNIYIVDRIKELIKYKGFQVAPADLEAVLLSHSEVLDAAVIPYPDEDAGQIPLAVVVPQPKGNLDEQRVINFVADQVAPYKKVRKVMFIDAIPKSSSGKILRRELVQMTRTVSRL